MIMVVVVIATLLGIWGLSSSRMGFLKAGNKAAQVRLQFLAQQGLQKGLRRIQEIADWDGELLDTVGDDHTSAKNIFWFNCVDFPWTSCLCEPAPSGGNEGCSSPACPDLFGVDTDWDVVNQNVVCNFLGTSLKNTQVILVRKADIVATDNEQDAIFLLNSIARDSNDRRQIVQGVIVVPYDLVSGTGLAILEPYLATSSQGAD